MKKVKFLLPVLAIIFAVAGVFATGSSKLTLAEAVSVNSGTCVQDGTCDQGAGNCELTSNTNIKFNILGGVDPCSTQSTGKFAEN